MCACIPHSHAFHTCLHSALACIPRSQVREKLFFSHVHKAAGSSFNNFLRQLHGAVWCGHLVQPNAVRAVSDHELAQWWLDPAPNCSLVSIEVPAIGDAIRLAEHVHVESGAVEGVDRAGGSHRGPHDQTADSNGRGGRGGGVPLAAPQLLTMFRDPADRCISSWNYEAALCLGPTKDSPLHVNWCTIWAREYGGARAAPSPSRHAARARRRRVRDGCWGALHCPTSRTSCAGAMHDLKTQLKYANNRCVGHITNSLARNSIDGLELLGSAAAASAGPPPTPQGIDGRHLPHAPGLLNDGVGCSSSCGEVAGYCRSLYCGPSGACCMRGQPAAPPSCGRGQLGCNGSHCCVHAAPPATPHVRLSFFGVVEAYDASICLFWFQV